jgi:hypothetical protein
MVATLQGRESGNRETSAVEAVAKQRDWEH